MNAAHYEPPLKTTVPRVPASFSTVNTPIAATAIFRLGEIRREEVSRPRRSDGLKPLGIMRRVSAEHLKSRQQLMLANGKTAYRYAIKSESAAGIRLHFQNVAVDEGEIWVYDMARRKSYGPYTGAGPNGSGEFWTPTATGDTVVVEYDSSKPDVQIPPFVISEIGHVAAKEDVDAIFADGPVLQISGNLCTELDVSCYADWQGKSSGVTLYAFAQGGILYACNGTLLNDTRNDFTPYFLTAAHCVSDPATAQSMEFVWDYQSSGCGGWFPADADQSRLSLLSPSGPVPTTVGAQLLVTGAVTNGDYTLLKLNSLPNMGLDFYGWDAGDDVAIGSPVTAVHHPGPDAARIAFGFRGQDQDTVIQTGPTSSTILDAASYYQVGVTYGHVEPGSSGSPLFSQDGRLVGTLTSIPAALCPADPFPAQYFRFAKAYPQLAQYLGSSNPGTEISPPATVGVSAPGTISLSKTATSWNWIELQPTQSYPEFVTVNTTAASAQSVSIAADRPWINVSDTKLTISQMNPGEVRIWIEPSAIASQQTDTGTVTFTAASGNQQTFTITLQVVAPVFMPNWSPTTIAVFPLVIQGPGQATTFQVSNAYPTPTNIMLQLYTLDSNPLIIEPVQDYFGNVDAGAVASSLVDKAPVGYPTSFFNNLLQPEGTQTYSTTMAPPLRQGMAISWALDEQATKSVPTTENINGDDIKPAVAISTPFGIPFDATEPGTTSVFLYNTWDIGPFTYTVTGYDDAGAVIGARTITVNPWAGGMVSIASTDQTFGGKKGLLVVTNNHSFSSQVAAGLWTDPNGHILNIPLAPLSSN